jgi:hypothetical protein
LRDGLNYLKLGCFIRLFCDDEVSDLRVLVLVEHVLEVLQRYDVCSLGVVDLRNQVLVVIIEGDLVYLPPGVLIEINYLQKRKMEIPPTAVRILIYIL